MKPVLIVVASVLLLSGCSSSPAPIDVTGSLTLTSAAALKFDGSQECTASSGYDDIATGGQVVVSDDGGKTIGLGTLTAGTLTTIDDLNWSCVFSFSVPKIPAGGSFYKVAIGHRDGVQFTEANLRDSVALTLG